MEHRFGVTNKFVQDVHIKSARASCGCTSPEVPVQVIRTWQTDYVVAKVDTVHFEGQKDVTITVEFDSPYYAEVQLNIHCFIRSDVVLAPGSVNLHAAEGTPVQERVVVRYAGRPNWQIVRVELGQPEPIGQGEPGCSRRWPGDLRSHGIPGGYGQGRLLAR